MNILDTKKNHTQSSLFNEIQVLTFTLCGIRFAVDTEGVYKMVSTKEVTKHGYEILDIQKKIERVTEDCYSNYESPRVLLIKKSENEVVGVIVDKPEEIFSVEITAIKPLPRLIEASINPPLVWGVIVQKDEIILLVDFYKIL